MIFVLKLENVCKSYGHQKVLNGINLTIRKGEIVGIIGPNGVGKTTLMEIICGVTKPSQGSIYLDGYNLLKNEVGIRSEIGVCFQESIFDRFFCIRDTLLFVAMYHGMSYVKAKNQSNEILQQFSLGDKRNSYGSELSGGMRKRFQLAVAMISHPKFLLLDEPTAGVDLLLRDEIYQRLERYVTKDRAAIITSHDLGELAHLCHKLVFIKDGVIVKEFLIQNHNVTKESLEDYYKELYA